MEDLSRCRTLVQVEKPGVGLPQSWSKNTILKSGGTMSKMRGFRPGSPPLRSRPAVERGGGAGAQAAGRVVVGWAVDRVLQPEDLVHVLRVRPAPKPPASGESVPPPPTPRAGSWLHLQN